MHFHEELEKYLLLARTYTTGSRAQEGPKVPGPKVGGAMVGGPRPRPKPWPEPKPGPRPETIGRVPANTAAKPTGQLPARPRPGRPKVAI